MANVSSSNGLEKRPKLRFPGFDEPWEDVQLFDVTNFRKKRAKSSKDVYVSTENLLQNFEGLTTYLDKDEIEGIEYKAGDTLLANIRPYLKKAWLASFEGTCSADVLAFSPEGITAAFLYNIIARDCFIEYVMSGVKGSKMPRGDKAHILDYKLSIPDKTEQEKISAFLAIIDHRIKKQREMVDILKKYKRGLLSNLFGEKSTQRWTTRSYYFSEIAQKRSEKYDPSSGIEYPCVELENIEQETGKILATVPSIAQSSMKNIAMSGDTLFGKLRPYLRKYVFAQQTMACSSEIWALIPSDVVLPKFLFYLVQTEQFLRVANISSGTKMPRAEWSNIEKTEFYIPDLPVQRKAVSLLERVDKKIAYADSMLICLNRLKASLLQQLFI